MLLAKVSGRAWTDQLLRSPGACVTFAWRWAVEGSVVKTRSMSRRSPLSRRGAVLKAWSVARCADSIRFWISNGEA
ncbi:hypothetical protein FG87_30620 [Nocardia vulneris]|uniref:Transposase n=1 Tax=Nocardia vulneris TaxID=1141657 RepID=A0ABR4Z884_9NOCA|nr:hypothetical protein FG87_30620 [Nocardia vulneris]